MANRKTCTPLYRWDGRMIRLDSGRGGHYTTCVERDHLADEEHARVVVDRYDIAPGDATPVGWPWPSYWAWEVQVGASAPPITDRIWYPRRADAIVAALGYVHEGELDPKPTIVG